VAAVQRRSLISTTRSINHTDRGTPKNSETTCPSATTPTTDPTWTDAGANQGLRGDRTATNRLSHGTAPYWTSCSPSRTHPRDWSHSTHLAREQVSRARGQSRSVNVTEDNYSSISLHERRRRMLTFLATKLKSFQDGKIPAVCLCVCMGNKRKRLFIPSISDIVIRNLMGPKANKIKLWKLNTAAFH
jgi:hypothetical protein